MNRTILARLISLMYPMSFVVDGGTGGTGNEPPAVKPEDARAFLTDFGHSPDALKTAKDEDVVKQYATVNANFTKRAQAEAKAAQEKATTAAKEAAKSIKLELPRDSVLSQADVDRVAATARERGLSKEDAEALLKEQDATVRGHVARQQEQSKTQRAEWVKTIQNDPELGGDKLAVTQKNSLRAIEKFMPPELREKLKETGFGDFPPLVKMLNAIGAAMAEDKGPLGGAGTGGAGKKSAEDVLYGSPQK
jgi:hypothetical protein